MCSSTVAHCTTSSRYVRCCVRVERAAYFKACFKAGACIKWSWIRVWRAYACQDLTSSEVRTLYQYIGANLRRCAYTCIHLGRGLDEHSLFPSFSSFSPLFFPSFFHFCRSYKNLHRQYVFYAKKWGGTCPPGPPASAGPDLDVLINMHTTRWRWRLSDLKKALIHGPCVVFPWINLISLMQIHLYIIKRYNI